MKQLNLLLATILVATTCAQPVIETFGNISGVVKSAETGLPLSGVTVSITPLGLSQITTENGAFLFDNLDVQEYTISLYREGYNPVSQKVSVKPGVTATLQLVLSPIPPSLGVNPTQLEFGLSSTALALDIINTGSGSLSWYITENVDWLFCDPNSGTTTNEKSPVTVSVTRDGLEQGSYAETLVISSNGGSQTIIVKMSVDRLKLSVYPPQLNFGTITTMIGVSLTNTSSGAIRYSAATSNSWLTISKSEGLVTSTDNFNAVVSRAGLSPGYYTSTIIITTDSGNISIPVNMEVIQDQRPEVTLEGVEDVEYNKATVKGVLFSIGSSAVKRYGFCWSETSAEPTLGDESSNLGDAHDSRAFTGIITNLKSETDYYVRAYAENNSGVTYSNRIIKFTTKALPTLPTIETGAIEDIGWTSAVVYGTLSSLGNVNQVTSYGHVWGTGVNPTLGTGTQTNCGAATSPKSFSSLLSDLCAETEYHVRAYAINSQGVNYGEDRVFKTKNAESPEVSTLAAADISSASALLNGQIKSGGGLDIIDCGFYYGKTNDATLIKVSCGVQKDMFSTKISGLDKGTTYCYQAYATNSAGESRGEMEIFTTVQLYAPSVTTGNASSITYTSATISGSITSTGSSNIVEYGFYFGISPGALKKIAIGESANSSYSLKKEDLTHSTIYYYQAYATNSNGTGYGAITSFKTATDPYNGHAYVDLGLPSGTKWATTDIGATSPGGDGDTFQWGGMEKGNQGNPCENVRHSISGTGNDAARAQWGTKWSIPTVAQVTELFNNCDASMDYLYGANCCVLISKRNKNSVVFYYGRRYWTGDPGNYFLDSYTKAWFWRSKEDGPFDSGSSGEIGKGNLLYIRPVCK